MVEQDTVKLLRECDAGVKMGISSIEDVIEYVSDEKLKALLTDCKKQHRELDNEIHETLSRFDDDGKELGHQHLADDLNDHAKGA